MSKIVQKMLKHPDMDEIISKLVSDFPIDGIVKSLKDKYSKLNPNNEVDKIYFFTEKELTEFKKNNLDTFSMIHSHFNEDLSKIRGAVATNKDTSEIDLVIKNNSAYRKKLEEYVASDQKIDIRKMLANAIVGVEAILEKLYDTVDNGKNLNTNQIRLTMEVFDRLGKYIEYYYKFIEERPDVTVNHNINLQLVDQYTAALQDAIREVLAEMDLNKSLLFMEKLNDKLTNIKNTTLKQVENLHENDQEIIKKLNLGQNE